MNNICKIAGLAFSLVLSAGFVACDGDSGTSAKDDESSSSIVDESSSSKSSSSSIAKNSSSSRNDNAKSSSSVSSSSSSDKVASSSSVIPNSSSVEESSSSVASSSSIATNSSSSRNDGAESSSSVVESSSSSVIPSSSSEESSSSSAASSSSAKSSSSSDVILSSSSEESSSSIVSSSSAISYGSLTDLRDNQVYKTVTIGGQTWMAENLNYAYNEGSAKSYCYNNSADFCAKYGRLYLWSAAMDSATVFSTAGKGCGYGKTCSPSGTIRGVCPEGWHLPSDGEWETLFEAVGGKDVAGIKLKSTSGWNYSGNGTDSFGFSVLPAGSYFGNNDDFLYVGYYVHFWSSTENDSNYAYNMYFGYDRECVNVLFDSNKYNGFSVRCLRND